MLFLWNLQRLPNIVYVVYVYIVVCCTSIYGTMTKKMRGGSSHSLTPSSIQPAMHYTHASTRVALFSFCSCNKCKKLYIYNMQPRRQLFYSWCVFSFFLILLLYTKKKTFPTIFITNKKIKKDFKSMFLILCNFFFCCALHEKCQQQFYAYMSVVVNMKLKVWTWNQIRFCCT